jgi:hypothetical protein
MNIQRILGWNQLSKWWQAANSGSGLWANRQFHQISSAKHSQLNHVTGHGFGQESVQIVDSQNGARSETENYISIAQSCRLSWRVRLY